MKRILIIIAMLWSVAQAQTTGYFRYDTSKFYTTKVNGRGSIDVTGNVKFTGLLPKSAGTDSVVVRDASGNLGTTAKSAFGGSQTWQQTLTAGSTLTGDNTITGGAHNFTWNNALGWQINATDDVVLSTSNGGLNNTQFGATTGAVFMSNSLLSNSHGSEIDVYPDSITLNPGGGVLRIDTLNYSGAASDSMVVWNKSSHNVGMRAIPSGSSTPSLTANQIAYGDGSNLMTSSPALKFTAATPSFQAFTPGGTVELGDISNASNGNKLMGSDISNTWYYDNTAHTGNFGINKAAPTVPLDVLGDINLAKTGIYSIVGQTGGSTLGKITLTAIGNGGSAPDVSIDLSPDDNGIALTNGTSTMTLNGNISILNPAVGAEIILNSDGNVGINDSVYVTGGGALHAGAAVSEFVVSPSGLVTVNNLTASKPVFTDASKNLTSTGPGTTAQYIRGDGSLATTPLGSVTSTSFTGGLISVANPTTTPAFTVAGTSGGIPYFSSTSTWASSGLLAANALVIGGGAGTAPSTTTTGTGVLTALGVNVGSAGAFVVNGGVLGTPSSGTVTNLTGTASININGTVGATTPTTGAFTTATASTSATTPLVIGGTTTTSTLTLKPTSASGITGADIIFQANNSAEVFRLASGSAHVANLTAGTLVDGFNALRVTATMPTTITGTSYAINNQITSAGSSSQSNAGFNIDYLAGYTGSSNTAAGRFVNAAAGTGSVVVSGTGNRGFASASTGTTTGANIGFFSSASNGDKSVGVSAVATTTKNAGTNIGVFGSGLNAGTTPIQIGGYFGLHAAGTDPTFASAALMCDNGSQTSNIFVARDNGTAVFTIADGGAITATNLAGTGSRNVVADASGVLSAPVSDRSVKRNINDLDYGLNTIMSLRPVSFEYKTDWQNYGKGKQIGFIAQEVNQVLPNSTFITPSTGKMGYNANDLIPVLVKAMQEQQKQIDELKIEIANLKK